MKHKHKRLTRAQRDQQGQTPTTHKCAGCGAKFSSAYALKAHKLDCRK